MDLKGSLNVATDIRFETAGTTKIEKSGGELTFTDAVAGTLTLNELSTDAEVGIHSSTINSVHGVTGDVVGTSDVQTLGSKTLSSPIVAGNVTASGPMTIYVGTQLLISELSSSGIVISTASGSILLDGPTGIALLGASATVNGDGIVTMSATQTLGSKTLSAPIVVGDVTLTDTLTVIATDTLDGADNKIVNLCGGGSNNPGRGGYVILQGNETISANPGSVSLISGASGNVELNTSNNVNSIAIFDITQTASANIVDIAGGDISQTASGGITITASTVIIEAAPVMGDPHIEFKTQGTKRVEIANIGTLYAYRELDVTQSAYIHGGVTIDNDLLVSSTATIIGAMNVGGSATFSSTVTCNASATFTTAKGSVVKADDFKAADDTSGLTSDVDVAKVGGGTRTLHFKNGLYTGYTDS